MKFPKLTAVCVALAFAAPGAPYAQVVHARHEGMTRSPAKHAASAADARGGPTEPGQGAFAAIAEIVAILRADPETDWTGVDIEALRRHLIDMDNVTMRAVVAGRPLEGGASFDATSTDPAVRASLRRMVVAHAAAMSGVDGMRMRAEEISGGARLTVTGPSADRIRGLGFIGLMTVGMHHQTHHLAMARGN